MSAITIQLKFEFVQDKQQKLLRCSAFHVEEMLIATHSRKVLTLSDAGVWRLYLGRGSPEEEGGDGLVRCIRGVVSSFHNQKATQIHSRLDIDLLKDDLIL